MKSRTEAALQSGGQSTSAILRMVARLVGQGASPAEHLVDVGCGRGELYRVLQGRFRKYTGCDLVRYEGFPTAPDADFRQADLNDSIPLGDRSADLVISAETIEHLENPRAFVRELVRVAGPGARVIVTTPNQLSILSKLALVVKNRFAEFQETHYPAHIVALLESDLYHIATECVLQDIQIHYSHSGRIPGTGRNWPSICRGRAFSDNIALSALRPFRGERD